MGPLNPYENDTTASVLTVPSAYRAWASFVNQLGYGGLQVAAIRGAESADSDRKVLMLCEVYARATFETAMSQHFDQCDSRVDCAVLGLIDELFGPSVTMEVHKRVATLLPAVRGLEASFRALHEAQHQASETALLSQLEDVRHAPKH